VFREASADRDLLRLVHVMVDATIVNVALPQLGKGFGASVSGLQ
jgi:hypothetical protein